MAGENNLSGSPISDNNLSGNLSTEGGLAGSLTLPEVIGETNYEHLSNLPQIEGVTLLGNKTHDDLKLHALTNSEIEALLTL